jgi:hypothetical protein
VLRKVAVAVLTEPQIWVVTVVMVEQAVEAAQVVAVQRLSLTVAQAVLAVTHK